MPSVHVWLGLNNPDSVSCTDTSCNGQLKWEDESDFNYQAFFGSFQVRNIHGTVIKEKQLNCTYSFCLSVDWVFTY